jgi:putative FmdB family regulatory protein
VPTYQYACTECGHAFEQFQSFTDDALTVCPQCEGRLRKVFNAVGVVFKGSGFYRNDSRTDAKNGASASSNGGEKSADKTGTTSGETSGSTSGEKSSTSGDKGAASTGGSKDSGGSSSSGGSKGSTSAA